MDVPIDRLVPDSVVNRIKRDGLPGPAYAAVGLLGAATADARRLPELTRELSSGLAEQGRATATRAVSSVSTIPQQVQHEVDRRRCDAVGSATTAWDDVSHAVAGLRTAAQRRYRAWSAEGEDRVMAGVAERVVRKRMGAVENQVVPRAAKAAVTIRKSRDRMSESERGRRAARAASRAKGRMRQSATRFAEMNAPVLMEDGKVAEPASVRREAARRAPGRDAVEVS